MTSDFEFVKQCAHGSTRRRCMCRYSQRLESGWYPSGAGGPGFRYRQISPTPLAVRALRNLARTRLLEQGKKLREYFVDNEIWNFFNEACATELQVENSRLIA